MSFQSSLLGLAAGSLLMIQPVLACDSCGCQQSCGSKESTSSRQIMTAKTGGASECQQSCSGT